MIKISFYLLLIFSVFFAGCFDIRKGSDTIRIKGSDTMLYLTRMLAAEYMAKNPDILIIVDGGGTAAGVGSFAQNEIDILTASRNLKSEEVKLLAKQFNTIGISYLIAKDALSVFINKWNSVRNLSLEELKGIFLGEIKNWNALGGDDADIKAIIRSPNSGTYLYFKEHALNDENYLPNAIVKATTQSIIDDVRSDQYAIGYGGIGYGTEENYAKINGILPTEENVKKDKYPLTRYLHFYTHSIPTGPVKKFIDWVISPEGQEVVKRSGYIAIWN